MKKPVTLVIALVILFFIVLGILYSSVLFKGYPAEFINERIVLARNFAWSGINGAEDDLNIVVAPELVKERARPTSTGNKLTSLSWAMILKVFTIKDFNTLVLFSAILVALACIIFTLTVFYLFSWQVAVIFPFIYALLPSNARMVQLVGNYEFALLYFSIFTLFYFWGRDQKYKPLYLIISGIFLSLACLAKEALFLFLPIFFLWLWLNKYRKELMFVFIPAILLLSIFWLPAILGLRGSNDYLKMFVASESVTAVQHADLSFYSHFYSDPYEYHFNRERADEKLRQEALNQNNSWLYRIGRIKVGANMGVRQIGIFERILVGTTNLARHISKFFAIEYIGGPLIFLLMLFGYYNLKSKDKKLYQLFILWLAITPLLLSYFVLAIRDHSVDFSWAISTLVALGLVGLLPVFKSHFKYPKTIYFLVILITLYSLVLSDHVFWGRDYDNSVNPEIMYLADKVNSFGTEIKPEEVIAVGSFSLHPLLNYLTSKSVVFFSVSSINHLVETNQLQEIFDKFGVKYIIGYNQELSDLIIKNSQVTNIANWPKKEEVAINLSYSQGWILNLIK